MVKMMIMMMIIIMIMIMMMPDDDGRDYNACGTDDAEYDDGDVTPGRVNDDNSNGAAGEDDGTMTL